MACGGGARLPDWQNLPPELISKIANHLDPASDIRFLRAVCTLWRSATTPPPLGVFPSLPSKVVHEGVPLSIIPTAVFLLHERRRHSASSPVKSWLVAVEQPTPNLTLRFLHPFTKLPIKTPNLPKTLSNFDFVQLSKGYNLAFRDRVNPVVLDRMSMKVLGAGRFLMVIDGSGIFECICIHKPGASTYIHCGTISKFHDIISSGDLILAVDFKGQLYKIENDQLSSLDPVSTPLSKFETLVYPRLEHGPLLQSELATNRRKRLVSDSNGDVYLIIREACSFETKFKVYKMNRERQWWDEVVSLGDRVLFVTTDDCFFASASDLRPAGFLVNCIVFPKDCFPDRIGCNAPDELLFDGASEESAVGVFRYSKSCDFALISSLRGYSDLIWPPPQWIWGNRESEDEKVEELQSEVQDEHRSDASSRAGLIKGSVYDEDEASDAGGQLDGLLSSGEVCNGPGITPVPIIQPREYQVGC